MGNNILLLDNLKRHFVAETMKHAEFKTIVYLIKSLPFKLHLSPKYPSLQTQFGCFPPSLSTKIPSKLDRTRGQGFHELLSL